MSSLNKRTELFENTPIKKAVLLQIMPAIASQMIALIYNLADTYFVGVINDPVQTAAITIVGPCFVMLTAISNLFGVGGASAIARALGKKEHESARQISFVSFWCGLAMGIVFAIVFFLLERPILTLCGAKTDTIGVVMEYAKWVVVIGGPATVLNTLLANLVRAEGSARQAFVGVSMGGVLNIILDPFFVLPRFLGLGAAGAGIATAISNTVATVYFLCYVLLRRQDTVLSLAPRHLRHTRTHLGGILAIGFPSALQYVLTVVAVAAQAKFVSAYPTEAVAALGIVKKIDQMPLYFSIGVASGLLPLLAYNHAAGNTKRRAQAFRFGTLIAVGFSLFCLALFEIFAKQLVGLFIENPQTVTYGASFLRMMVTAMPMMSVCYPMIIQFQAMGKAKESLICSVLRKGVLDIPLLFLMDALLPLYGCMLVQPMVDSISLIVALVLYRKIKRKEVLPDNEKPL